MRYPFQSTCNPISHRNEWSFSRLHNTVAKSRTGVKFSPRCDNRGKLTPGRLVPACHFVVVSCKQMQSDKRNRSELAPARKSPQRSVNTFSNYTHLMSLLFSPLVSDLWQTVLARPLHERPSGTQGTLRQINRQFICI